jgi:hypothetical protein
MYKNKKRRKKMDTKTIIELVLKVVAMAMAIVSIVMGFFPKETTVKTHITLLSTGLAAPAIAALQ